MNRDAAWVVLCQVWQFMDLPVSEANEEAVGNLIVSRCSASLEKFDEADALAAQLAEQGKAKPGASASLEQGRPSSRSALGTSRSAAKGLLS